MSARRVENDGEPVKASDKEAMPMTPFSLWRGMPFAILAVGALLASTDARSQGTAEQREACASDAVNLCQDTIPDVPKTTACMKAHFTQLSPRCQKEFSEATGISRKAGHQRRVAGHEDETAPPAVATAPAEADPFALPRTVTGMSSYEAQILDECKQGLIDSFTCHNTLNLLRGIE